MSTLIATLYKNNLTLAMNRDQVPSQAESGVIQIKPYWYPYLGDKKSTWLGVHRDGRVYALLYGFAPEQNKKFSRERIIPSLLEQELPEDKFSPITARLKAGFGLEVFNSFQLFSYERGAMTVTLWDGNDLFSYGGEKKVILTSSVIPERARSTKEYLYTRPLKRQLDTLEALSVKNPPINLNGAQNGPKTLASTYISENEEGFAILQDSNPSFKTAKLYTVPKYKEIHDIVTKEW